MVTLPDAPQLSDTLEDEGEPNSSAVILEAIEDARRAFEPYWHFCDRIDRIYSSSRALVTSANDYSDNEFDIFWASLEIIKPAIYAKSPKPIAAPRFKDANKTAKTTAELLERALETSFDLGDIDQVMLEVRDDLAIANRGQAWVRYESEDGKHRVCYEHLDSTDFLHEPARKWADVGWVARRAWMTKREMDERFEGVDFEGAEFHVRTEQRDQGMVDSSAKAGVWEVWSRIDNRVYWVVPGCPVILDEDEPHLHLRRFFPCPMPAYGTLKRRSLIPVPDYKRYEYHLEQINTLTGRVYNLLDQVKLKGLYPGGGSMADAIGKLLESEDDSILLPVPEMTLANTTGNYVQWLPLTEIATAIQGLIEARSQLINDFYQLSGISDIMRGATEAEETLGAQRLKVQSGSVRVRQKIDELQRFARDMAEIAAEIMAENFPVKTLLSMAQMDLPKKAEIAKETKDLEKAAKEELEALQEQAEQMAMQAQGDPEAAAQAEEQFNQAQQQILAKYEPTLQRLGNTVVWEDVEEMLRDELERFPIIEIETDSTILTDEIAEKELRAEWMNAFSGAATTLQPLAQSGPAGADLAGAVLKFTMQPYRANREIDSFIDAWVDEMKNAPPQQEGGENAELAAANMQLAQAEIMKAQNQGQNYQAQAALKMQELQLKAQEAEAKTQEAQAKFQLEIESTRASIDETLARTEKIMAEIRKMGFDVEVEQREQNREDVKTQASLQDQRKSIIPTANWPSLSQKDIYTIEQLLERGVTMSDGTAPDPNPFNEAFLMKEWERRNGS